MKTAQNFETVSKKVKSHSDDKNWCQLVSYDLETEKRVIAGLLYRFSNSDFQSILNYINSSSPMELESLVKLSMDKIEKFDIPPRELEYSYFTFDIMMDQGAFFEIKRHRMMTSNCSIANDFIRVRCTKMY